MWAVIEDCWGSDNHVLHGTTEAKTSAISLGYCWQKLGGVGDGVGHMSGTQEEFEKSRSLIFKPFLK